MRIFTLNIKGRKQNVSFVKAVLNYVNADIVSLIECGDNPGTNYIGTSGLAYCVQNSSYVAVLSKLPFTSSAFLINYTTPYAAQGMNNRSLLINTTEPGTGKNVTIVSAHLDSNNYFTKPLTETLKGNRILDILSSVSQNAGTNPVIMAGDFNSVSAYDWSYWIAPNYANLGANAHATTDGGAAWLPTRELISNGYVDLSGKNSFNQVAASTDLPKRTWRGTSYTSPINHERIDMVWAKGVSSYGNFVTLDETNTPGVTTWSTDHNGVMVDVTL